MSCHFRPCNPSPFKSFPNIKAYQLIGTEYTFLKWFLHRVVLSSVDPYHFSLVVCFSIDLPALPTVRPAPLYKRGNNQSSVITFNQSLQVNTTNSTTLQAIFKMPVTLQRNQSQKPGDKENHPSQHGQKLEAKDEHERREMVKKSQLYLLQLELQFLQRASHKRKLLSPEMTRSPGFSTPPLKRLRSTPSAPRKAPTVSQLLVEKTRACRKLNFDWKLAIIRERGMETWDGIDLKLPGPLNTYTP